MEGYSRDEGTTRVLWPLYASGLINTDEDGVHTIGTANGMFAKRTTKTGIMFLKFVGAP